MTNLLDELPSELQDGIASFLSLECFALRWRVLTTTKRNSKITVPQHNHHIYGSRHVDEVLRLQERATVVSFFALDVNDLSHLLISLQMTGTYKHLEELTITQQLTDTVCLTSLSQLQMISKCRNLRHLSVSSLDTVISNSRKNDFSLLEMCGFHKLSTLEAFFVHDSRLLTSRHLQPVLLNMSRLTRLALAYSGIDDSTLHTVARTCPQMSDLCLTSTSITDSGIAHLLPLHNSLTSLQLHLCLLITDSTIYHLSTFTALRTLSISCTNIGGDSLQALQHIASLRLLELGGCKRLRSENVLAMTKWPCANQLMISIDDTLGLTREDLKILVDVEMIHTDAVIVFEETDEWDDLD